MGLFRQLYENRKLIFQMGKNDFKNKYASTSLGAVWGFIQPLVFMFMYMFVFQFILKQGTSGNYPYVVWFLPGIAMWMFFNDAVINGCTSIRSYSYLVKKIVFPIGTIPFINFYLFAVWICAESPSATVLLCSCVVPNYSTDEGYGSRVYYASGFC